VSKVVDTTFVVITGRNTGTGANIPEKPVFGISMRVLRALNKTGAYRGAKTNASTFQESHYHRLPGTGTFTTIYATTSNYVLVTMRLLYLSLSVG
jgi:hypothetical protein